jgi:FkbM family methyltransferase
LSKVFDHFEIDTVLDVGANAGQYHDFLRQRVGFNGVIHSFEPVSRLAEKLAVKARDDAQWIVHQHALGAEQATREIRITASDTFSSFLDSGVSEESEFAASIAVVGSEQVLIKRLDDLWRGLGIVDPARLYLKIDTQGFDIQVLRGATELLSLIKAFQFELPVQPIYKGSPNYLDILKQLEESGFALSGLFPISIDERLRAVEFDCVMVARDK